MPAEVVVAGHICLDVIPKLGTVAGGFRPGRLIQAGPAVISTGGAVSNTGLALHKLGVRVRLAGKIGDDAFGSLVRDVLERHGEGLGAGLAVAPGEFTSYTVVLSPAGQDRTFLHAPGCNDSFAADDVGGDLASPKLLHFGYPTLMRRMFEAGGSELERLLRTAKEAGLTTSLDLSLPDPASDAGRADWRQILKRALPWVDLFLPSAEELLFMLRRSDFDRLAAEGVLEGLRDESIFGLASEAADLGAKIVLIKAGFRGLYLRTRSLRAGELGRAEPTDLEVWRELRMHEECYRVEVVGTTGAGDASIAGFLRSFLRGGSPPQCLQAAAAVGACCCEAADSSSGVLSWPETAARIEAGWPKTEDPMSRGATNKLEP